MTTNTKPRPAAPKSEQLVECPRCFGLGVFRNWRHIDGGRCFTCRGEGRVTLSVCGFYLANAGR
jgi:DnaJ-class molecular chaperone